MEIFSFFYAIIAAIIYASIGYIKSVDQDFDMVKFLTTILFGAIIGAICVFGNIPITQENIATQMAAYGGLTIIIENIVKSIVRRFR